MTVKKITATPIDYNYKQMKKDGFSQAELTKLSFQAVEDNKIDAKETAVLTEVYQNHLATQGEFTQAELLDLPPQVQNLFQDMRRAKTPNAPAPVPVTKLIGDGPASLADGNLSPARKEMKQQLDAIVTTSRWGYEPNDAEVAAGKRNLFEGMTQMSSGTTCGLLPGSMLKHMGILQAAISGNATNGIETEAKRLGVWVESDGSRLPKPGDVYALRYEDKPNTPDSVAHVGVVYATGDQQWTTADAGQGSQDAQAAGLVKRNLIFDAQNRPHLSGPDNVPGDSAAFRRVAGWVDLDRLMFLQSYQDMLVGTVESKNVGFYETNDAGIDGTDLRRLAGKAMRDGELDSTERSVFVEIAHHAEKLSAEDIAAMPLEIRAIFNAPAISPAPAPIALPGDSQDKSHQWHRRSKPIVLAGTAADHS